MTDKIQKFLIGRSSSIKKAMEYIDKSGGGIVLVVDKEQKLQGVVTDGDIRRALLTGHTMATSIKKIMIKNPTKMLINTPTAEMLKVMREKGIRQIPLVDKKNILKDIVLLSDLKNVPLSLPDITNKEIKIINQVLSTPFLSIGPKIAEFEKKISEYVGTKYAVAVNSGTSALHLCVRALDIKDGDEVITTPFSFIASANCMLFERAIPVFVDIDKDTLCIDVNKIEEKITSKTKAILPVHVFGYPCQMDKIMAIAKKHKLAVIEDSCEAIGTKYKNKMVGSFGDAGVFAFYPNKQITTAEGGMIVTNSEKIAKLCRSMRNQGRDEHSSWLSHKRLGYNYRMSELSAALGVVQMERISEILKKRQRIAEIYNQKLKKIRNIQIPYDGKKTDISWFVYVIRLSDKKFSKQNRDKIMKELKSRGIACSNYFPPIHLEPFYVETFGYKKGDFPVTEKISDLTIALPFHNNLSLKEIDYVCDNLREIVLKFSKKNV